MDCYDDLGFLIRTDRFSARCTGMGDDVMNPGVMAALKVTAAEPDIYCMWLMK